MLDVPISQLLTEDRNINSKFVNQLTTILKQTMVDLHII